MNQRVTNNNGKNLSEWAKRVEKIRRILAENNNNVFAERVGITPQLASAIVSGNKGVGRNVAEKILAAFPAEVVMRWTEHADWASMRPYVAIVDELKKREMDRFDGI